MKLLSIGAAQHNTQTPRARHTGTETHAESFGGLQSGRCGRRCVVYGLGDEVRVVYGV